MRKFIFTLILSMAFITASFHAQVKKLVIRERIVSKSINMTISTDNNYSAHAYKYCDAKINYTVIKIRGAKRDTLVQKQFLPFKLKELHSFAKSFNEQIAINEVADRKEQILIHYTVTYSAKGSELRINRDQWIPRGVQADTVKVNI